MECSVSDLPMAGSSLSQLKHHFLREVFPTRKAPIPGHFLSHHSFHFIHGIHHHRKLSYSYTCLFVCWLCPLAPHVSSVKEGPTLLPLYHRLLEQWLYVLNLWINEWMSGLNTGLKIAGRKYWSKVGRSLLKKGKHALFKGREQGTNGYLYQKESSFVPLLKHYRVLPNIHFRRQGWRDRQYWTDDQVITVIFKSGC
jgi:hypothetical protein